MQLSFSTCYIIHNVCGRVSSQLQCIHISSLHAHILSLSLSLSLSLFPDCETMGGSNEFFDKFSIRYHISVILKQLWEHPTHQAAIKAESRSTQDNASFMRFINMLINDTTFLLDESLDALKAIRDTQEAMKDKDTWESQPPVSSGKYFSKLIFFWHL